MKKINYLIGAAAIVLASCANDELVRTVNPGANSETTAMSFGAYRGNQSRATQGLENEMDNFGVWAIKVNGDDALNGLALNLSDPINLSPNVVMNNYVTRHLDSPVFGSSWSYVTTDWPSTITTPDQYLKYWDGSYTNTYFFAYGPWAESGIVFDNTTPSITFPMVTNAPVSSTTPNYVYADAVKAVNADYIASPSTVAPRLVPLSFHHVLSSVQIKLYEDIPGYTVEMESLQFAGSTDTQGIVAIPAECTTDGTTPIWSRGSLVNSGKAKVTYSGTGFATSNLAYIGTPTTAKTNLNFDIPTTDIFDKNADPSATLAPTASATVYNVMPATVTSETNSGLQFVMNFKLKAKDTKEVIHVKGARVFVPAAYTNWAPNTKYTYIFKITKNASGTTLGTDPKNDPEEPQPALYPIVFDNVSVTDWSTEETEWILNSLLLSKTETTLVVDGTETLVATAPDGAATTPTILWASTVTDVATVDKYGKITAVKAGKTVVQASCSYTPAGGTTPVTIYAQCIVTVVNGFDLNKTETTLAVDGTETLKATLHGTTGTVTWSTSDAEVATVDNTGVVTGVAAGTATITATVDAADGKTYTATCVVTVTAPVVP